MARSILEGDLQPALAAIDHRLAEARTAWAGRDYQGVLEALRDVMDDALTVHAAVAVAWVKAHP